MTISTETDSIAYTGNGIQTAFTYNFLMPRNSAGNSTAVVFIVDVNGNTTVASPATYSISGLDNPSGGTVVFPLIGAPIDSQTRIIILRNVPYVQLTAVANQGFYPHTLEQVADYLTLQTQQLNERAGRAITVPPGETSGAYLPAWNVRAGKYLAFDGNGNPIAIAGGGGGGGGSTLWSDITAKPNIITAFQNLTPTGPNQVIEFTSPTSAHLIPTPGGGGGSGVSSVNGQSGALTLDASWVNSQPIWGNAIRTTLVAGANMTLTTAAGVTTFASTGGGGSGNMQPRLLSDLGPIDGGGVNTADNDAAFTAAEAAGDSSFYIPDGIYATSLSETVLSKHYVGRGIILFPGTGPNDAFPAKYSYMATKPTTWPTQGKSGFFRGDQRFTDGGEYYVIGPNVRTYDIAGPARYFESNTMPHFHWMDVFGGNSGSNAQLRSGASVGQTVIPLPAAATAAWVGKTVAFAQSYGGAPTETRTITAVNTAGNNITVNTGLSNNYVWNPAAGLAPNIYFHLRTSASLDYSKMILAGGGDAYNYIMRQNNNYVPKATETHAFMASTAGNLGGDVYAGADGVFLENQEWQIQGGPYDIAGISYLASLTRANDFALDGGKVWLGTYIKADGGRPSDVGHAVAGSWRNGFDTGFASLYETSRLTANAPAGTSTFTVASTNGAHPNDPVVFGSETLTIQRVLSSTQFTTTAACVGSYVTTNLVTYLKGGAALNMAKNHRIIFNSSVSQNARGGDPAGVFSSFYGNVQGDLIMESGTDTSDFWTVRFARGTTAALPDTARIRLRADGAGNGSFQIYGTANHTVAGPGLALTAATTLFMDISAGAKLSLGPNVYMQISGGNLQLTLNGGVSFHNL